MQQCSAQQCNARQLSAQLCNMHQGAAQVGDGWVFEPHTTAGKTNDTRARWIVLALAIDLDEKVARRMLSHVVACCRMSAGVRMRRYATALRWQVGEYVEEFHAVPQKLVVSIQGCGAAPEPGPGLKCATPLAYQDLLQVHARGTKST